MCTSALSFRMAWCTDHAPSEHAPSRRREYAQVDPAALKAKLTEDGWEITEKPRPTKEGQGPSRHSDKYYRKPGDRKQSEKRRRKHRTHHLERGPRRRDTRPRYRSLLEIARAHYPELLGESSAAMRSHAPRSPRAGGDPSKPRAPRSKEVKPMAPGGVFLVLLVFPDVER